MTRWSDGALWEPAEQPEASVWGAIDPSVPYPAILIGGLDRCAQVAAASWETGRSWWTDAPEAGSASAVLVGRVTDIAIGAPFVVDARPGPVLWVGTVDDVTYNVTPDGWETRVVASNALAALGNVTRGLPSIPAGTLAAKVEALATAAGIRGTVKVLPSSTFLPTLNAEAAPADASGLLAYLKELEKSSNAIVALDGSGEFVIQPRAPLSGDPDPESILDLVGDNCPESAALSYASPTRLFNGWMFGTTPVRVEESVTAYGLREYETVTSRSSTALYGAGGIYYPELVESLAGPLAWGTVTIRIPNRLSPVAALDLFDWVAFDDGRPWQVLASADSVAPAPEGESEWHRTLTIAATINDLGKRPPVVVPPAPTRETRTVTCAADRDCYVVLAPGGGKYGNGASDNLLVGLLADGNLCRSFVRFNLAGIVGTNRKVTKAILRVWNDDSTCLQFGSSAQVTVSRVTSSWSEGTYSVKCGFGSANSTVYPGPGVTTTGAKTASTKTSDNAQNDIDVTAIAQAWINSGSSNYGVRIAGSSETSTSRRTSFWGRSAGTSSRRPVLIVTYERDVE
jgi:hypothetical protein